MKKKLLLISALFTSIMGFSQWQPTNLTAANYLTVTGTETHNGELYSIVFNGFSASLYQLDPGNTSWTVKTTNGVTDIPATIKSTGNRLYMTSTGLGYSMLHYSTDNGVNFIADTVGLPKMLNGINSAIGLNYFNGKIMVNLGSAGYWIKDTSNVTWQHIDPVTSLNGGTDPICYSNDTLFAHDNSGANIFYVSGDYGQTWIARSTNLPSFFIGDVLVSNKTTGRLYLAGAKTNGTEYGVYYSDDNGFNWTIANLSSFIGTDVNGGQQEVITMYANNGEIFIALENDAANTTPDVLSSSTGINNMIYDTLGLVVDPAGSINGGQFLKHNGQMVMALNVRDVYLKGNPTSIDENSNLIEIKAYPNPVMDFLTLKSTEKIISISVKDISGKEIISQTNIHSQQYQINLQKVEVGIYFIDAKTNKINETLKIVKR